MRFATAIFLAAAFARPLHAQSAAGHLKLGVAAYQAVKTEEALEHFKAAVAADSASYEANWRVARAAIDIAMLDPSQPSPLLSLAEQCARKAVALDSMRAEGHMLIAVTASAAVIAGQERKTATPPQLFRRAKEVIKESKIAIRINPKLDTPHRLLGVWYANISGVREQNQPGVVDAALGDLAADITWNNAIMHLERARKLAPKVISNRLALGQVYAGQKRPSDARAQLKAVASLPLTNINDTKYKELAKATLATLPAASP